MKKKSELKKIRKYIWKNIRHKKGFIFTGTLNYMSKRDLSEHCGFIQQFLISFFANKGCMAFNFTKPIIEIKSSELYGLKIECNMMKLKKGTKYEKMFK